MKNLYVFALVEQAATPFSSAGHRVEFIEVESVYAAVERRRQAPALSEGALRAQHEVVAQLADRVPAVLPARFGAFVDAGELGALVSRRRDAILASLALVRGRRQMTMRLLAADVPTLLAAMRITPGDGTGTTYLESRRAAAAALPIPGALADMSAAVRAYVVAERAEAGRGRVLASLYHLVEAADVASYKAAAARVQRGTEDGGLTVTGPWAPYAFAPDMWA